MKKLIFLPAILLVFYLTIFSIITFGIVRFQNRDHFAIALTFELIGFLLLACVAVINMIANPPVKTGFFAPLTLATLFYTAILHFLNFLLVPPMPSIWGVLLNLILLFIYLAIGIMMVVAGRMDARPHSGVLTQHTIGREARQEGTRECPHCSVMIPYSVQFCPVCGKPSDPPEAPKPPVPERMTPPASATFGGAARVMPGNPGAPGSAYAPNAQQVLNRPPVQPYAGQPYAQPGQPYLQPGQPYVQPGQPAPYAQPGQPYVQPGQPAPYAQPGQPYVQPGQPAPYAQLAQPYVQPAQPVQPDMQPAQPVQPEVQPAQPVQPDMQSAQPVQPEVQPAQSDGALVCTCGTPLLMGSKFCPNCGRTIG